MKAMHINLCNGMWQQPSTSIYATATYVWHHQLALPISGLMINHRLRHMRSALSKITAKFNSTQAKSGERAKEHTHTHTYTKASLLMYMCAGMLATCMWQVTTAKRAATGNCPVQ